VSKKEVHCIVCKLLIVEEDEQEWALDDENHPGVLGPCHRECYRKVCEEEPETPWTDSISGEVDWEGMGEDLGVWPATEDDFWEEEGDYAY